MNKLIVDGKTIKRDKQRFLKNKLALKSNDVKSLNILNSEIILLIFDFPLWLGFKSPIVVYFFLNLCIFLFNL